jgi:hypothetical protein
MFRGLLFVCFMLGTGLANAQEVQPVPHAPIAKGDQLWVLKNGTVIGKFNGSRFENGDYVSVDGTIVGSAFGCLPRQPQAPPPQPFPVPPPFETPKLEVPELPELPELPEADGPDLLQVLTTVGGIIAGWYIGRKYADDDDEQDAPAKEPAVA